VTRPPQNARWRSGGVEPTPTRALLTSPRGAAGFSLLELLITLALLIIMVVMWHGFGSQSNQQRQLKACQKNLQQVYLALEIYANEHQGRFPAQAAARTSEDALSILIPQYTTASGSFICPGSKDSTIPSAEPLATRRISYAYFMGWTQTNDSTAVLMSDRLLDALPKTKGTPVFSKTGSPPGNNHHQYGGNFLFVDGRQDSVRGPAPFTLAWPESVTLLNPKP